METIRVTAEIDGRDVVEQVLSRFADAGVNLSEWSAWDAERLEMAAREIRRHYGKEREPKPDGPNAELLRSFVEALMLGSVSRFANLCGYSKPGDDEIPFPEYYREIARRILTPQPKGLKAWLAKYYPVPADKVPKERAARESLRKWRGLTPEVLEAYGLTKDRGSVTVTDGKEFHYVAVDTCPLCQHFRCAECVLRKVSSSRFGPCAGLSSPYAIWKSTGNATPMIEALEKAAALEEDMYGKD